MNRKICEKCERYCVPWKDGDGCDEITSEELHKLSDKIIQYVNNEYPKSTYLCTPPFAKQDGDMIALDKDCDPPEDCQYILEHLVSDQR
jgi:hypothetical protein